MKYLVFDLGGVMIEWAPEAFVQEVFHEEKKEISEALKLVRDTGKE